MSMKLSRNENYNFFSSILTRYIPKDCVQNGSPYHLFRLLMLYHDPELCAFLDTKKVAPDSYAHLWVTALKKKTQNVFNSRRLSTQLEFYISEELLKSGSHINRAGMMIKVLAFFGLNTFLHRNPSYYF